MLDENCKPWLLEVNYNPSLSANTPLDWKIKSDVIADAFRILGVNETNRRKIKKKEKRKC